jgi:hypothetical protein
MRRVSDVAEQFSGHKGMCRNVASNVWGGFEIAGNPVQRQRDAQEELHSLYRPLLREWMMRLPEIGPPSQSI